MLFFAGLAAVYWPLTRVAEPAARELWFRTVARARVIDGSGLSPPVGQMWLGASRPELPQSLYGVHELERRLGRRLAIASFYQAWGDGEEHRFPADVLRNLHQDGYLPMVTWEPWLSAFERWRGQKVTGSLRIIAAGGLDAYVRAWARAAVRHRWPFLLRLAHEPTNPWYAWAPAHGNTATDFHAFWSRVHRIFRDEGARNALFVWTPYGLDEKSWFPGAAMVDWVGLDVFNYGGLSQQGIWLDFYSITKLFYDAYRDLGPPLLLAEAATSSAGGNKADWLRDMFHDLGRNNFPRIRAVVLFDQPSGQTGGGVPVDWSLAEVDDTFDRLTRDPDLLAPYTRRSERSERNP
jgi:hypothetical protein